MSDEHLDAITDRLDDHSAKLDGLTTGVEEIRVHLMRVDARFDRVDKRFDGVETRLDKLEIGQETLIDQVKQIAEGHAATQAAIAREGEKTRAHIDARIAPIEMAVRGRV